MKSIIIIVFFLTNLQGEIMASILVHKYMVVFNNHIPKNGLNKSSKKNFNQFRKYVSESVKEMLVGFKNHNSKPFLNKFKYLYYNLDTALIEGLIHERKLNGKSNNIQSFNHLPTSEDFEELYVFGVKSGIVWKNIKIDDIKVEVENDKFIIEFILDDNGYYIFIMDFRYDEDENFGIVRYPHEVFTMKSYQYNKGMKEIEKNYEYVEGLNKKVLYIDDHYWALSKKDSRLLQDEFKPYYIFTALANYYNLQHNYFKAVKFYTKVINFYSSSNKEDYSQVSLTNVIFLRAQGKIELRDFTGSLNDLELCYKIASKQLPKYFYYYRGLAKKGSKNITGAIQDFTKSIIDNKQDKDAFFERGLLYFFTLKNKKAACIDWSKSGELGDEKSYKLIGKYCN